MCEHARRHPRTYGRHENESRERNRTVTVMTQTGGTQPAAASSGSGTGGLFHILELPLDRGLVIDVLVRVSLVGIEILKHARADEFTTAGRRLAHGYGDACDFRLRGPLPPYSFAA
ncbi:gas vesicle structural protein [Streptomyces azureus]|uniref:Gas vesicle structural protein n=1 Tax=Streptomyces azureus TaxID=146537 RepID=A0A0K8PHT7_STRAJ|nr:gas vesicle structural protein [Streptomyces azureus]